MVFFRQYLRKICYFLLLIWFVPGLGQAQTAQIHPQQLELGDVATLTIEADTRFPALPPLDTSELEKDFQVLDIVRSVAAKQVQGMPVYSASWSITLYPRQAGELTIPALTIGKQQTPVLQLKVFPANAISAANGGETPGAFVELRAEPAQPVVGQQLRLLTRFYFLTEIVEGSLAEPEVTGLELFRNKQVNRYQEKRFGHEYQVQEQQYVVFPEKAGELPIQPVHFVGQVSDWQSQERQPVIGSESDNLRHIYRASEPLRVNVQKKPENTQESSWLPATKVVVSQEWLDFPTLPVIGSTFTRRVKILAEGQQATALPTELFSSGTKYNVYPDQPMLRNTLKEGELSAELEQDYGVVITEAGEITLPELSVYWWDTLEQTTEVAVLPERKLMVSAQLANANEHKQLQNASSSLTDVGANPGVLELASKLAVLISLVAIIILGGIWLLWGRFYSESGKLQNKLKHACLRNDAWAARNYLLNWVNRVNSHDVSPKAMHSGLHQITAQTNQFKQELVRLDAALYSQQTVAWQGKSLWQAFQAEQHERVRTENGTSEVLPTLYPANSR